MNKEENFWNRNSLSIVFGLLFLISMVGQTLTGWNEHNHEQKLFGKQTSTLGEYLGKGHFIQATFENWESEFLQMFLFVFLTISLRQKGSSESKDLKKLSAVDREPMNHPGAPWPVRKGGWILEIYKHSLSIALFLLFIVSFISHWFGSLRDYNEEQEEFGKPIETAWNYLGNAKLWFESFQNWQSEFLSVVAIVVLSIFLRQKGSAQSKPVDAPDDETGT